MECDYKSVKDWLKRSRKDLKKKVISKSEFNRVRKIAGYTSFLNALEASLNKSEKSVDEAWCKDFAVLAMKSIEISQSKHEADVFFALGFRDGVWDFRVDFLPESISWASQMNGGVHYD